MFDFSCLLVNIANFLIIWQINNYLFMYEPKILGICNAIKSHESEKDLIRNNLIFPFKISSFTPATRNAFRFCFLRWDKKLTEIEKLYKTTDAKLFFLIYSIRKLQLNFDTKKKQNPVKKLEEVCRPCATSFSFWIFLISQNVNQLTTASFPSSGLFCDDVCSYSVEVLWGHMLKV